MISHLLETIANALDARRISYMIIGGQAVLVHGEPRMTKDVDVTLGVSADRLGDILLMVSSLGWEVMVETPESFVKRTMVLPCRENGSRAPYCVGSVPNDVSLSLLRNPKPGVT